MRYWSTETITILTLAVGLTGLLTAALEVYRLRKRSRYDDAQHRVELEMMRRSIETELHALTDRLVASESRWRDVNHLLLSSQERQPEKTPEAQQLALTSFLNASGLRGDDIKVDKTLVFVLTPFHPEFQKSFNAIASVCTELGLRPLRGDEEFIAGDVFPHILRLIVRARIVIANIEGRNPNVFYELGLAHALGKTTILVAEANKEVPFDIKAKKLILYKSLFNLKQRLRIELARSLAMEEVGDNVMTDQRKRKKKPPRNQIKDDETSEVKSE